MNYLEIANSGFLFVLCLIPVLVILVQTFIFIRAAWRKGIELGFDKEKMKKCITTSATFSVIPSLSLVALFVALSVGIGKFFPWLRLSNIGAGAYEAVAAEIAMTTTGASSWEELTLAGFVTVMLCMNLGMSIAPLNTLITAKGFNKSLKKARTTNPFILIGTSAAFAGIIARLTVPYFLDVSHILPLIAAVAGALIMFLCTYFGKNNHLLIEFGLSLGIIGGVVICILAALAGIA